MSKIKRIITIFVVFVFLLITYTNTIHAVPYTEVPDNVRPTRIQNEISYIGGGKAPYVENGRTYYYGGNVIELTISLPSNTYAIGLQEVVTYDLNQLELITSFADIRRSVDQSFYDENWSQDVSKYSGNNNQILIMAASNYWPTDVNTTGGAIARMRFRIKEQTVTATASNINLNFLYQIGSVNSSGVKGYIHEGYDAANDATTFMVSAPTISLSAHKTPNVTDSVEPVVPVNPDVEYHPSIIIDKVVSEEKIKEIIEITSSRDYSFKKLDTSVNGENSYKDIAQGLIENTVKVEEKAEYKSYEFKNEEPSISMEKEIIVETPCYTHYIYIGLSFLIILITYGYKKYLEANKKVKWRS